jgi:hypothetical protein
LKLPVKSENQVEAIAVGPIGHGQFKHIPSSSIMKSEFSAVPIGGVPEIYAPKES